MPTKAEQEAAKKFMEERNKRTKAEQEKRDISPMFQPGSGIKSASDVDKVTQGKTSRAEAESKTGKPNSLRDVIKKRYEGI